MKLRAAKLGQDYATGFMGFCKTHATGDLVGQLSNTITFFEDAEEKCGFEKALSEDTPDAPSHVFIVSSPTTIIHAYKGGVQEAPLSMFMDNPNVQVVFREPSDLHIIDAHYIVNGAASIIGHPYNYTGLIGRALAIVFPLHHWGWYMQQPLLTNLAYRALGIPEPYYCSAAASHALKNCPKYEKAPLFERMHESKVMPSTLYAEGPFKPLRFDKA